MRTRQLLIITSLLLTLTGCADNQNGDGGRTASPPTHTTAAAAAPVPAPAADPAVIQQHLTALQDAQDTLDVVITDGVNAARDARQALTDTRDAMTQTPLYAPGVCATANTADSALASIRQIISGIQYDWDQDDFGAHAAQQLLDTYPDDPQLTDLRVALRTVHNAYQGTLRQLRTNRTSIKISADQAARLCDQAQRTG